jgi:hypothetical protein
MEFGIQFLLPLLNKEAWAYNQAAATVTTRNKFLDEETSHNRFAGSGVVSE